MKNEQKPQKLPDGNIEKITKGESAQPADQLAELQFKHARERDARREDWFMAIVLIIIIFDVMFFSVMPSFGGPIALVILQLLFLIPLATRLGMQEIAKIIGRVLERTPQLLFLIPLAMRLSMQEIAKIIGRVLARTSKNSSGEGD